MPHHDLLTSSNLRNKWAIALESGFFKPTTHHLRVLDLSTYSFTHSPLGVLCAISRLGEFIPEALYEPSRRAQQQPKRRRHLRHLFSLYSGQNAPIPSAATKSSYPDGRYSQIPVKLAQYVGITPKESYWEKAYPIFPVQTDPPKEFLEYFEVPNGRYTWTGAISLDTIMSSSQVPTQDKFPLIATLLRYYDSSFYNNITEATLRNEKKRKELKP